MPRRTKHEGYKVGSTVEVRLYSGETIQGVVKAIHESTKGRKIQVAYEGCTGLMDEHQIIGVVEHE